jgi:hypothetical protein
MANGGDRTTSNSTENAVSTATLGETANAIHGADSRYAMSANGCDSTSGVETSIAISAQRTGGVPMSEPNPKRVDVVTRADKREHINRLKDYIKRKKPTYKAAIAYGIIVFGWSRRNAVETIGALLDGEIIAAPRNDKGKPLPDGKLRVIDGEFFAEMTKHEDGRKLEAMK